MRKSQRGWTMPEEDARSMLTLIKERIRSSDIRVEHRDALIRLRAMIEDDLAAFARDAAPEGASTEESRLVGRLRSLGGNAQRRSRLRGNTHGTPERREA